MTLKLHEAAPGSFFLHVPSVLFGTRRRVRVRGTMNGHAFGDTPALPGAHDEHLIAIDDDMRAAFGIKRGDTVNVEIEADDTLPKPKPKAKLGLKTKPKPSAKK